MELEKKINAITKESLGNNGKGLRNIANAERILKQAYEGRYFFELIQNVRDANREANVDGKVIIEITEEKTTISNTGGQFSLQGIESITNIGESTKQSQEFIGHKGIGFKSILEITESPKIITRYGTILFDRDLTIKKYSEKVGNQINNVPLFFFPHFAAHSLNGMDADLATKIELFYKDDVNHIRVINDFKKIKAEQIVLLGNIKEISCSSPSGNETYTIHKNGSTKTVELTHNNQPSFYKEYTPKLKAIIPEEIIESLEDQEKNLFKDNADIDIKILLKLDKNKRFIPVPDAKLYLFYPLKITSGFQFLIHSYFIVSPDRKELRENVLNDFLFQSIGNFITGELLQRLKKSYKSHTLLDVLVFDRVTDSGLEMIYDTVQQNLTIEKFVYDSLSEKFYAPLEVIMTDGQNKHLFPDGIIQKKRAIHIENSKVRNWLYKEFNVKYLTSYDIEEYIEEECKRQRQNKNFEYFQTLYNYVTSNVGIDLHDKKVFLTSTNKLVTSDEDVFYRGKGQKKQISLPKTIRKKIHFIHPSITISDFRDGQSRTGIKEFSTYELTRRIVKLFQDEKIPNKDIIESILTQDLDQKSLIEIKDKILVPIKGKKNWMNPITNPIYFPLPELKLLYPTGNFIDLSFFESLNKNETHQFLIKVGVWEIPAVYILAGNIPLDSSDEREQKLASRSNLSSRPFYLRNDRCLHVPEKKNKWFTDKIIGNWRKYKAFIVDNNLPRLGYSSSNSGVKKLHEDIHMWELSGFLSYLSNSEWLVLNEDSSPLKAKDIIGISEENYNQPHWTIINSYLTPLPSSYFLNKTFFKELGILHLETISISEFQEILIKLYETLSVQEIEDQKKFIQFYNKILSKLFDCYAYRSNEKEKIIELLKIPFLAYNEFTKNVSWADASDIFYRNSPGFYKQLPKEIKKLLQPQFTNQDKNTFGQIAIKIGRKITQSINQTLVPIQSSYEAFLKDEIKPLHEMIALLEYEIDRALTSEELLAIKGAIILKCKEIEIDVTVLDTGQTERLQQEYFSQYEEPWKLYILEDPLKDYNTKVARAITNLFSNIFGRELKRVETDILSLLKTPNKIEFLDIYNISSTRLEEIRQFLDSRIFSKKQRFYYNILKIKKCELDKDLLSNEGVNLVAIAEVLKMKLSILVKLDKELKFEDLSDYSNINALMRFFSEINLTLGEYNQSSFPKINFKDQHLLKLNQLKNKLEGNFQDWLYDYLKDKSTEEKSQFQKFSDRYKNKNEFKISGDHLVVDYSEIISSWLKEEFPFYNFELDKITDYESKEKRIEKYKKNKNEFIRHLGSIGLSTIHIDDFLASLSRSSLLYFDFPNELISSYKEGYGTEDESPTKKIKEDDLSQYFVHPTSVIKNYEPGAPERKEGNTTNKGGSKTTRVDGSSNNSTKEKVGLVAEKLVFEILNKNKGIQSLKWVSKYASKIDTNHAGYNPEGDDKFGYDLEYLDEEENKIVVEVKGRSANENSFIITKNELKVAFKNKEHYQLIFVNNVFDNVNRAFRNLQNPFLIEEGQDFMNNKKFIAINNNYEISFE